MLEWQMKKKRRPDKNDLRYYNLICALLIYAPLRQTIPCTAGHIWNYRTGLRTPLSGMQMRGNCSWPKGNGGRNRCRMPKVKLKHRGKTWIWLWQRSGNGSCSCWRGLCVAVAAVDVALVPKIHAAGQDQPKKGERKKNRYRTWHASIFGQFAFVFVAAFRELQ